MGLSSSLGVTDSDRKKIVAATMRVPFRLADQFDAILTQHLRTFSRDAGHPLKSDQVSAAIAASLAAVGVSGEL